MIVHKLNQILALPVCYQDIAGDFEYDVYRNLTYLGVLTLRVINTFSLVLNRSRIVARFGWGTPVGLVAGRSDGQVPTPFETLGRHFEFMQYGNLESTVV